MFSHATYKAIWSGICVFSFSRSSSDVDDRARLEINVAKKEKYLVGQEMREERGKEGPKGSSLREGDR